jgi:FMN phosphatase YigB (HAD superfamily)
MEGAGMGQSIRAILFDLDGTLLDNDMEVFLPPYFAMLTARMAPFVPREQFLDHLMRATEVMMANDGRATNEEVFAAAFYPLNEHSREELEPVFAEFYAEDFPELQRYTRRKPHARPVVEQAFGLGCDVIIATNPLFPATAVQQRLAWAGVEDFPYRLVTTYENSRAAKPNLRYFEDILEAVGQPAEAALVVGDEDMDMVAGHLGCPTFLVPGSRTNLDPTTPEVTYRGSLGDVIALLQSWA